MRSEERTPFTPVDLCGLIAHETAAVLYGVGVDSIPSAEAMRAGLETFAAGRTAPDCRQPPDRIGGGAYRTPDGAVQKHIRSKTNRMRRRRYVHVLLTALDCSLPHNSMGMLEQLRTLDKLWLHHYTGSLSKRKMDEIDAALEISIGLAELAERNSAHDT